MGTQEIREHMQIIGSCGTPLGCVDRVEGDTIKLTKDSCPDGRHHFIPLSWVARVDGRVHLKGRCDDVREGWRDNPVLSAGG